MDFTITRLSVLCLLLMCSFVGFSQEEATDEPADEAPVTAVGLYNSGLTKLKAKDYEGALPMMVDAIAAADTTSENDVKVIRLAKKNGARAAYYVGTSKRKAKKMEEAITAYQLGVDYDPGFYANFIGLAQSIDGKGDKVKAVSAYLAAAEVCGKSEKTQDKVESMETKATNIVIRLFLDKKIDESLMAADTFLAVKESADVYCYQAKGLLAKGKSTEALVAADKAVGLLDAGGNADLTYFTKGEIHQALGQKTDAIGAFKKAGGKYADSAKYKMSELEK